MKKLIIAVLAVCCISAMFAGCGVEDALVQNSNSNAETTTQAATQDEAPSVKDTDYSDDFDGLCDYFAAMGYIVENAGDKIDDTNVTVMDASLIGAENGKKFATTYNGKSITVELYSYDTQNLNDTAKEVISSVENNGTFTILDFSPVTAYISDNGKYLMIYSDSSIDESKTDAENYTHREQVIEDFKAFHAAS